MAAALRKVLGEMQSSPVVPPSIAADALAAMNSLYNSVVFVADGAKRAAAAQAVAPEPTPPARKLRRTSSSPSSPSQVPCGGIDEIEFVPVEPSRVSTTDESHPTGARRKSSKSDCSVTPCLTSQVVR